MGYADTNSKLHSQNYPKNTILPQNDCSSRSGKKVKWRFNPGPFGKMLVYGGAFCLVCRIILFPLVEGISQYTAKSQELSRLQNHYITMKKQIVSLQKTRAYMLTPSYIEERGHQIGMVKPNEAQMVVVETSDSKSVHKARKSTGNENYRE